MHSVVSDIFCHYSLIKRSRMDSRYVKCTEFKSCEKSSSQINLLSLIYGDINANSLDSKQIVFSLQSERTKIFDTKTFTASKRLLHIN